MTIRQVKKFQKIYEKNMMETFQDLMKLSFRRYAFHLDKKANLILEFVNSKIKDSEDVSYFYGLFADFYDLIGAIFEDINKRSYLK